MESNKIVCESLQEYRNVFLNEEQLTEDQLNELNLANLGANIKGALTGQGGKTALYKFFDSIKGKTDVPDQDVINTFSNVYSYSFGKYPKYKEVAQKMTPEQKFTFMKKSKDAMDANPKFNQPALILVSGKLSAGALTTQVTTPSPVGLNK